MHRNLGPGIPLKLLVAGISIAALLVFSVVFYIQTDGPQAAEAADQGNSVSGDQLQLITLVATAQCVGEDLQVTISDGDGPFDILASSAPPGNTPLFDVPAGTYTGPGPGTWTNLRVVEQSGDFEIESFGNVTCTAVTDTPVPPTDTPEVPTDTPEVPTDTPEVPTDTPEVPTDTPEVPTDTPEVPTDTPEVPTDTPEVPTDTPEPPPTDLAATVACNGADAEVTITSGEGPFDITASAGVNTPVLGVGIGTTTINGPEKWDNLTVTETSGDGEFINFGQVRCRSNERVVPLTPAHRTRTTNTQPLFSWTGISNANNYRVFLFDDADPLQRTIDIRQNSGGPTQLVPNTPLPISRLFWRARGRQNRIWSLWSIRFTLWIDPPPVAVPSLLQ